MASWPLWLISRCLELQVDVVDVGLKLELF